MPNCPACHGHAKPADLKKVGAGLACGKCRKLRLISIPVQEEKTMADVQTEKQAGKKVLDLRVLEVVDTAGAVIDHSLYISFQLGGATFAYDIRFDAIRAFFTERKTKAAKRAA